MTATFVGDLSRSEMAVVDAIRARGQATRGEVAAAVGLGTAMTGRVVTRLQDAGVVRPTGRSTASGQGRQALLVEVEPELAYVLGVDIGTELVHLLVADAQGATRAYYEWPSDVLAHRSHEQITATLAGLIHDAVRAADVPADRLSAIGVAVTGIIDSDRGICLTRSNTPGWNTFALADDLGAQLNLPVVLDETARAKALAELHWGGARGASDFLYVDAGTSIGAGIVINKQALRGAHGLAGELGHVTVDPTGPLCRCGNRGCVQASASARTLVARARDLLQRGVFSSLSPAADTVTLTDIASAATRGDKLALSLLTDAGEQLGEAISMALNLLGLDLVIVGGALAHCSPVVLEAATRIVRLRVLPVVQRERTVECSRLGRDVAARGVALEALDAFFATLPTRAQRQAR